MNVKILNSKLFIYIFFLIISFLIRYYLFEGRESWHDEWHSVYVANPNFSNTETLLAYYGDKGDTFLTEFYPPLYIFILKYVFIIFGYIDDNGRWFSIITGTLMVPLSIYITNLFLDIKKTFFVGILLTFNLFLIWQSLEIRAHSFLVFISLINIILFYKILEKKNYVFFFSYGFVSIFLLSLWPITGVIFFGKTIYLIKIFFINKTFEKKIFILFFFILIVYSILNIDYLKLNLSRDWHYTQLYSTFFYNYHFRTFFGSPVLGAFYLLLFSYLLYKNFKKIIFHNGKENLLIYIIISSYVLTLLYTLLRASIMSPKYVIFILPLIIIWIGIEINKIKKNKIIKIVLVLVTMIICLFEINNSPIKRPPTEEVLNIIKSDNSKYITTIEIDVFNAYISSKKVFIEEKFILIDDNENDKKNKFPNSIKNLWFVCLNNPSFVVGDKNLPDDKNCKDFYPENKNFIYFPENSHFVEVKEVKIRDFLLKKFENKNYLSD